MHNRTVLSKSAIISVGESACVCERVKCAYEYKFMLSMSQSVNVRL